MCTRLLQSNYFAGILYGLPWIKSDVHMVACSRLFSFTFGNVETHPVVGLDKTPRLLGEDTRAVGSGGSVYCIARGGGRL